MVSEPAEIGTLSGDLRGRSDEQLLELLRARPDLTQPPPADIGQLAVRATTRSSVLRALDRLDRADLTVLEAAALLHPPVSADGLAQLLGITGEEASERAQRLWRLALLWGQRNRWFLVRSTRDVLGPHVAGLGPPARSLVATLPARRLAEIAEDLGLAPQADPIATTVAIGDVLADPTSLDGLLAELSPTARAMLDRLASGPPVGREQDARRWVRLASARVPVDELLARGLLVPVEPSAAVLPREVGLHLRGGRLRPDPLARPRPAGPPVDQDLVDRLGAGTAAEVLRSVTTVLESWARSPAASLRAGGIGVRELRRAAALLDGNEGRTALLLEVAYAAGLLATDTEGQWLPTAAFDAWSRSTPAEQWVRLVQAWARASRVPSLAVPTPPEDTAGSEKSPPPLSREVERAGAPDVRSLVIGALADAAGTAPPAEQVVEQVLWHRPRRSGPGLARLVAWTMDEAAALGVTARDAITRAATTALLPGAGAGAQASAAAQLSGLMPAPLDHVLIQADLTAVAPGPLEPGLAREMSLLATVESTGGATVYRFTPASLRTGMDAGRSASDITSFLTKISRTPVPQPLLYLVEDVARSHGRLRIAPAVSVISCDDPATLDEIEADPGSAALVLRRMAPTVLIAQTTAKTAAELLRELGQRPSVESSAGVISREHERSRRAPAGTGPGQLRAERPTPSPDTLAAVLAGMRAGDRAAALRPGSLDQDALPGSSAADVIPLSGAGGPAGDGSMPALVSLMVDAVERGSSVWIRYLDQHGAVSERVIDPSRLDGGWVTAFDHRTETVRSFALHRIAAGAPVSTPT